MLSPFDWEKENEENQELGKEDWDAALDWNAMRKAYPIPGQKAMFPPDKNYFLSEEQKLNKLNSDFETLIYKNPAYTVKELSRLHKKALKGMGPE